MRKFISKFTVRRTKKALNAEIEKNPEKYQNKLNRTCKFPKQIEKTYDTKETEADLVIVRKINELASALKGVTYLTTFHKPAFENSDENEKWIKAGRPWIEYLVIECLNFKQAGKIERYIKAQKSKKYILQLWEKPDYIENLLNRFSHL